jgi:hypothetical protein
MTEKQLIELDFTRNDETAQSSGAPNDWHYYTYNVGSFCLISSASDEVEEDGWFVEVFETPEIRFTNPTEVNILLTLLTNNYKENGRI